MDEKEIVKFLRWLGDCYGMDDKKEAERVAKEYISEKKIEALNIQNVSVSFPTDGEIEERAEYMQRPRNPSNDIKEEFIYGYMQGADWIINKYKPNER